MKKNRMIAFLLAVIVMVSCVSALAQGQDAGLEMAVGKLEDVHLTVANATKVNGMFFTRQFGNNTSDMDVRAMIHGYNPIVWNTQIEFVTDPMVVEKLETTKKNGNTVYVFTLCKDLTWNDGTPITAKDYVFAYLLQASKQFEEIGGDTDVWRHIVGYEEYVSGEKEEFEGIRLLGAYKYSVTVKKEYLPYFYEYSYLYITPSPMQAIAPGCSVADNGKGAYICNEDTKANRPVFTTALLRRTILDQRNGYLHNPTLTCGPYDLVSYDPASGTVEFTANPYYKGNYAGTKPAVKNVTLINALPQDMPGMLAAGEIDIINKAVSGEVVNELMGINAQGGFGFENYPRLGYGYIGLACEQGPQQFVAVRKAIARSFDDESFVREYLQGYGLPVYGFYGIGQWMAQAALGSVALQNPSAQDQARWEAVTLDGLDPYAFDPDAALELLVGDGWVLNAKGEAFDPEKDSVRYKMTDSGLMALSFRFGLVRDNAAANEVLKRLRDTMEPMGVAFDVREDSFANVLNDHLREGGKRNYDMCFMAYNFNSVFDPMVELMSMDARTGSQNAMGVIDDRLYELCVELHKTQPGDVVTYLERWVAMQEVYNELLPTIPLYSNVYFDFYKEDIRNYHPGTEANWPSALLYSFVSDEAPETGSEEFFEGDEYLGDDEIIID